MHGTMEHTVMKSTILLSSRSLRVGREWSRVPDDLLVLDGAVRLVHGDFEWGEVGFIPMELDEVSSGLVDNSYCPARNLLRKSRMRLLFLHFAPSFGEQSTELWVISSI